MPTPKPKVAVDIEEGFIYSTPEDLRRIADALDAGGSDAVVRIEFYEAASDVEWSDGTAFWLNLDEWFDFDDEEEEEEE